MEIMAMMMPIQAMDQVAVINVFSFMFSLSVCIGLALIS